MRPKIIAIIGARPQFIKHFPFENASVNKINLITIHTGQHYDNNMSSIFFDQLKMKKPDYTLSIGSSSHGDQTGRMMIEIENIIIDENPDGVVVYGDTNSTLAGALVASKLNVPVFHIEAGLRSYNREMPEEINRVLTDHISTLLFVPSGVATNNLSKEGINKGVYEVGDIMKDLVKFVLNKKVLKAPKDYKEEFYYSTIHRPYNTDNPERLRLIFSTLNELDKYVVLSLHPRTKNLADHYNINFSNFKNITVINPQSYFDNLSYLLHCNALITDSGGMQKEAYWLMKKCITIRKETEWTETLNDDANILIFENLTEIKNEIRVKVSGWNEDLYGKGNSADKMVNRIVEFFNYKN